MARSVPCGLIHLPYLPAQLAEMLGRDDGGKRTIEPHQRADFASMDLATQVRAVAVALQAARF